MGSGERRLPTFVKYLLLETPGWLLAALVAVLLYERVGLSASLIGTLLAVWVAKDLILYPLLKDALSGSSDSEADKLLGRTGVVETALDPVGIVRLGAELWRGEPSDRKTPIPSGTRVRVTALRGLTLVVKEAETDWPPGGESPTA
jgi:membrane protein implicated in regulation of membrane protease activity